MGAGDFAFPDGDDVPAQGFEFGLVLEVALLVAVNFGFPEIASCVGDAEFLAALVSMPKAAMHKDDRSVPREHNVRTARKFLAVEPITEPTRPKKMPHPQLRPRVLAPDARHQLTPRQRLVDIGHTVEISGKFDRIVNPIKGNASTLTIQHPRSENKNNFSLKEIRD